MAKRTRPRRHRPDPWPAGLPNIASFLSPVVAFIFNSLRVGIVLRDKQQWYPLHLSDQPFLAFELEYGKEREREAYNGRSVASVERDKKPVLGQHAGFSDYFVPVLVDGEVRGVLITGPFSTSRPTSAELLARWRWLTGRQGLPSDPDFVEYVTMTLDRLTLAGDDLERYLRLLECFSDLLAGHGDAHALAREAGALGQKLEQIRFTEVTWEAVHSMLDERQVRGWSSTFRANELTDLGFSHFPEHALVGLVHAQHADDDPVGELLARDAFQRACVELCRTTKNVVSGRVGEHGVVFLIADRGSPTRVRVRLGQLANRISAMARSRFGLAIHVGVSDTDSPAPLSARYEQALDAAETALSEGRTIVLAKPSIRPSDSRLRRLREQLGTISEARPAVLIPRFERYIEAVSTACGYRIEAVRAHLDTGFDRAVQALRDAGALEPRSLTDLYETLDRATREAETVSVLLNAYRRGVTDLVEAAEHPVPAAQGRSLRRALAYIRQHFAEDITLARVAQVAGFSPRYFSRLFREREAVTFERYVRRLRIEHARHLLESSDLSVQRVAFLSGFGERAYFHRVFREQFAKTPAEYRASRA